MNMVPDYTQSREELSLRSKNTGTKIKGHHELAAFQYAKA